MWVWSYLRHRIVVDVNDLIQISGYNLCDLKQTLEVKLAVVDKAVESDGGQVANSHLIRSSILHNLSAQVAGLDGTKVLGGRDDCVI
jgi:hypothetical protein